MADIEFRKVPDAKQPTWLGNADGITWKIQCSEGLKGFGGIGDCHILKRCGDDAIFYAVSQATSPEAAKENVQHLHEEYLQYNPLYHEVRDKLRKSGMTGVTIQQIEQTHKAIIRGQSHFSSPDEKHVVSELRRKLDQAQT